MRIGSRWRGDCSDLFQLFRGPGDFDGGEIVTKPLLLKGAQLRLNAKAAFGEILVEALNAEEEVIVAGDQFVKFFRFLNDRFGWRRGGDRVVVHAPHAGVDLARRQDAVQSLSR